MTHSTTELGNEMGRDSRQGFIRVLERVVLPLVLLIVSPLLVVFVAFALIRAGGSVELAIRSATFVDVARWAMPTWTSLGIVLGFAAFEALLLVVLPGRIVTGPVTPGGARPEYRDNGLLAWAVTHLAFFLCAYPLGWFSPTVIYDHFGPIIATSSLVGLVGSVALYWKGRRAPRSPDAGTSDSPIFDVFWGTELHPRIGKFDIKQFANCRLGMMSWGLIVWSCAANQHALTGRLSAGMCVVVALQFAYIVKFFHWERGYFSTLDVMHDRFGFYIGWGVVGWLPVVYPSAALYLAGHPTRLAPWAAIALVVAGLVAIWVNLDADEQRQRVRAANGDTEVWRRKPTIVHARYRGPDGSWKTNLLLASGWWGVARHFHYAPEIALAVFWTLPCGFSHVLPYFYPVYLTILLVHRAYRDDRRCHAKYGSDWDVYCEQVRYRILPGVF